MIDRRALLRACGAMLAPSAACAQTQRKVYRVGYLGYTATNTPDGDRIWGAFVQRLRELGFAEGTNLVIEQRFGEGHNERYAALAAELVRLKVDVVVASSGTAARAVMAASRTMPIVTTAIPDPVRAGLIASFARPGGQLTGVSNLADELVSKRLELLKAAVPAAMKIAYARCSRCNLTSGASEVEVEALHAQHEATAHSLGVTWLPIEVSDADDFDKVAAQLRRERPDALLIGATSVNVPLRERCVAFAAEQRLPVLAPYRGFGALLSYGPEYATIFRKVAEYVARILGGARPGDLPMEEPTKFEFVVNLKMAKDIGLTIPQSLLLRADEVIQ